MIVEVKRRRFLPYFIVGVILFYVGHLLTKAYEQAPTTKVNDIFGMSKIEWAFSHVLELPLFNFQFSLLSLYVGIISLGIVMLVFLRIKRTGYYRYGEEHGSARYATIEELNEYADDIEENNMILSRLARVGLFNNRLPFDKQVNKNMAVIGGSGDGKTFTFLKPNALQENGSKIFTDTKGLLVRELGHFFEKMGYNIIIFDLITFLNSNRFNVYRYMTSENDIDRVSEAIVTATKKSDNQGEDFWIKAETLVMRALIGFLYFDSQVSGYQPNLPQITDLVRNLKRKDPEIPSPVERLFDDLEKALPGNYACRQWDLFNNNYTGETRNSVFAIVAARFAVFDHDDVRKLLEDDNMEIDKWNLEKTVVFISVPEVNEAYQFISSLLFSTIFETTIRTADSVLTGVKHAPNKLLHLQIFGDEIAQVGKIPHVEKYMAVIRSREISMKWIIQSESQMVDLYGKEKSKTIFNNCGTIVYLGTNDKETSKTFSERAGAQTIQDNNQSETRSQHGSTTTQHAKIRRDLLTPHEIMTIPYDEVLVFVSRLNVFRDKKANVNEHKHAKYLANSPNDATWYRYKRYMNDYDEFLANVKPSHLIDVTEEEIEAFAS